MVSLLHLPMSYEASHFIVILPFCVYEIPPSAPAFLKRPPWHISAHSYCSVMVKRPRENLSPCSKRPPFPFFPSLVFTHKHASSPATGLAFKKHSKTWFMAFDSLHKGRAWSCPRRRKGTIQPTLRLDSCFADREVKKNVTYFQNNCMVDWKTHSTVLNFSDCVTHSCVRF